MKAEEEELVMVVVIIDICTNLSSPPIPHDSKSPEDRTSYSSDRTETQAAKNERRSSRRRGQRYLLDSRRKG